MLFPKGVHYFAHPYTARDGEGNLVPAAEEANFNLCNIRAGELLKRGYNVYSPISHTHPIHRACPAFLKNHEHKMWYHLDNQIIARMKWDGIILAPGWEDSTGCCDELDLFRGMELPNREYDEIIRTEPVIYDEEVQTQ